MAENKTEFLITARDETRDAFRSVEAGLGRVSSAMGRMFGPLAALASVAGFGALIKSQIDLGDQLNKTSQKLGITVEHLSAYQYAAKLSDVSNEQLTGGLAKLAKTMQDAASNKTGEAAIAFRALGVSVTDAAGNLRPLNLVLDEVSQRFEETRDGTNKTAMAMQLFGRSGAEVVPLLNSLRSLSDEARRTGNVVSSDFAKKSEQFNDSMTRMGTAAGNFARTVAGAVVPALANLIERFNVAIGAQESLSVGLLQMDKEFLQVEYKAMVQAAEKGFIINTNRLEFLKKQIDEIDAKIAASQAKAVVAAAVHGTAGGGMPEMPSINRQSDKEGIGDKEAEQTAKYMAELSKQLNALYLSTAPRLEALGIEQAEKQAIIDQGYLNGLLSEALYYEQSAALNQQYQDKLTAAALQGSSARNQKDAAAQAANNKTWASGQTGKLEVLGGVLGGMANLMQSGSKKQFEIGKKAAIGEALIATYTSAVSAFKALAGIPYVGPALGAVAAAAAVGFGLSNVKRIQSQQFGGGGAGGGSVPTFNASPNTGLPTTESASPVAPSLPQSAQAISQPRIVNINLESASGQLSAEYVRDVLIPGINDAVGDGVTLRVT